MTFPLVPLLPFLSVLESIHMGAPMIGTNLFLLGVFLTFWGSSAARGDEMREMGLAILWYSSVYLIFGAYLAAVLFVIGLFYMLRGLAAGMPSRKEEKTE